jgi:hypothetical protein
LLVFEIKVNFFNIFLIFAAFFAFSFETKRGGRYKKNMIVPPILISVKKIWDHAPHSGFCDLFFSQGRWFLSFREGKDHVKSGGGKLRILTTGDKEPEGFLPLYYIEKPGIDLRDPKLTLHPEGYIQLLCGFVEVDSKGKVSRIQTGLSFGDSLTTLRPVYKNDYWIWRMTWHEGWGYGVAYPLDEAHAPELVRTRDGEAFEKLCEFDFPMTEATIRVANGQFVLVGRVRGEKAVIGYSDPPFSDWNFLKTGFHLHGPDLLIFPTGEIYLGGRLLYFSPYGHVAKCGLVEKGEMSIKRQLILPSLGDTGYPSFIYKEGMLWTAYHSGGEEALAQIYVAKVMPGHSEI